MDNYNEFEDSSEGNIFRPIIARFRVLSRAATDRVQLTFTTSSTKRRRLVSTVTTNGVASWSGRADRQTSDPDRKNFDRSRGTTIQIRKDGSASPSPASSSPPPNQVTLSSTTTTGTSIAISSTSKTAPATSSPSPSPPAQTSVASPRYIPAHLQDEVLGAGISSRAGSRSSTSSGRSTPEPAATADSSSAACAGLQLNKQPSKAMSAPDHSDGPVTRSSSPGTKRRMSEITRDNELPSGDVNMDTGAPEQQTSSAGPETRPAQRRAMSVDMTSGEGDAEMVNNDPSNSDTIYPTPSSMSTYAAAPASKEGSKTHDAASSATDIPSIDEQVAAVMALMQKPLVDKQKGYVVSASWLNRVLVRSSQPPRGAVIDKKAAEGEIGPVDNSDLVLVTDSSSATFKDEAGEPFVPLRPGLTMGEDFEIVPAEAWDLMMKWYGLASQSPAIVRYAHNTNTAGGEENIQYEINPPIFTILRLVGSPPTANQAALKDQKNPPAKMLASRHTLYQQWLRRAKKLAGIDMNTKVRVWKVLGGLSSTQTSGVLTPAQSRSSSPAPGATLVASAGNNLALDVNDFLSLQEGSQRELLEDAKDQTMNDKYNGSMTLDLVGLTTDHVVVLDEMIGGPGGPWSSEPSKSSASRLALPAAGKNGLKLKPKTPTASGRTSPALEPPRGRRKDGRPRGNTGFNNLGNTCYMASALQCLRSVEELTNYFLNDKYKEDLNPSNPLSHNGDVARVYASLLHVVYFESPPSFSPKVFKQTIGRYGPSFSGYAQQDSQEFLLFLLDGLHEDLNRIQKKPYIEKPDSTDEMVHDSAALKAFADRCWDIYKARNDSVIVDLFAGMYKSTLVCPVCDKVSIIFDPFNNLTLQLPVENLWTKEIFYFPLNKPPVLVTVEIDKNASIKSLKEYVAKKTGADPQKLVLAEIYKHKFYKMFDNTSTIADSNISPGDDLGMFELEMVPTNYNPDKPKKFSYSVLSFDRSDGEEVPSLDSPKAERILVPLFHRVARSNNRLGNFAVFGAPSYLVFTKEEARDYDTILRKVLNAVSTMTTRDIWRESEADQSEESTADDSADSDAVVMNADDASESHVKTSSVQSEDGLVDISMKDASDQSDDASDISKRRIPPSLRKLFSMRFFKSKTEAIPLGFTSLDERTEYPLVASRLPRNTSKQLKRRAKKERPAESTISPESSEDELTDAPAAGVKNTAVVGGSIEGSNRAAAGNDSDSPDELSRVSSRSDDKSAAPKRGLEKPELPLIRPGEAIVLDWSEESHDALFGGKDGRSGDGMRGTPTWANVPQLPDPELEQKRAQRRQRKKSGLTLDQCLDEFGREEILSENDAWYCPRCKEHRRASKKFELWKTPDILVIHLKRFSASRGFRDKIDELVDFPIEGLDLSGRVACPSEGENLVYDLFAVDNHYGGLGGGHYTAYAKNFLTGEWNEYNDSHVSRAIDPKKVVSPAAYLLFYRRRSDRPLGGKLLQEICESSVRDELQDSAAEDSDQPSGEGRRLVDSSRNGLSSALGGAAAGASHQAGVGGLRAGLQVKSEEVDAGLDDSSSDDDDSDDALPPKYSNGLQVSGDAGIQSQPPYLPGPTWSFDRVDDDLRGPINSRVTGSSGPYYGDDEDLFNDDDDAASNKAVGGGDLSDTDMPIAEEGTDLTSMVVDDVPHNSDDEDQELPVVELRVHEDERIV